MSAKSNSLLIILTFFILNFNIFAQESWITEEGWRPEKNPVIKSKTSKISKISKISKKIKKSKKQIVKPVNENEIIIKEIGVDENQDLDYNNDNDIDSENEIYINNKNTSVDASNEGSIIEKNKNKSNSDENGNNEKINIIGKDSSKIKENIDSANTKKLNNSENSDNAKNSNNSENSDNAKNSNNLDNSDNAKNFNNSSNLDNAKNFNNSSNLDNAKKLNNSINSDNAKDLNNSINSGNAKNSDNIDTIDNIENLNNSSSLNKKNYLAPTENNKKLNQNDTDEKVEKLNNKIEILENNNNKNNNTNNNIGKTDIKPSLNNNFKTNTSEINTLKENSSTTEKKLDLNSKTANTINEKKEKDKLDNNAVYLINYFTLEQQESAKKEIELYNLVAELIWFKKTHNDKNFNNTLRTLKKNFPDSEETYYFIALDFYQLGKNVQALAMLDSAIEKRQKFARAWNLKGIILSEGERNEESLKYFDKAVSIDKFDPDYSYNLAYTLYKLKKFEASNIYTKLTLENKPNSASAYYLQGMLLKKNNEFLKALTSFTLAEKYGQSEDIFYKDFLELVLKLNIDKETLRLSEILYKTDLENLEILRILIKVHQQSNEFKQAIILQKKLLTHTQLKFEDYKDYVYSLININPPNYVYKIIKTFRIENADKEKLEQFTKINLERLNRNKLLKAKDSILRTKKKLKKKDS